MPSLGVSWCGRGVASTNTEGCDECGDLFDLLDDALQDHVALDPGRNEQRDGRKAICCLEDGSGVFGFDRRQCAVRERRITL